MGLCCRGKGKAPPPFLFWPFFPILELSHDPSIHPSISVQCFPLLSVSLSLPSESVVSSDICFHAWPACSSLLLFLLLLLCLTQLWSFKGSWEPSTPIFLIGVSLWTVFLSLSYKQHTQKLAMLVKVPSSHYAFFTRGRTLTRERTGEMKGPRRWRHREHRPRLHLHLSLCSACLFHLSSLPGVRWGGAWKQWRRRR